MRLRLTVLVLGLAGIGVGCPTSHDTSADAPAAADAPSPDAPLGADARVAADAPAGADAPTTPDAGTTGALGDCDTDADCPGGTCVALTPGGYRVCRTPPAETTSCAMPSVDQCCTSADCASGRCYLGPIVETCGGPTRLPFNECASDRCASDGDCGAGEICAPAGTLAPVATCAVGSCRIDADCTAEAGGHCVVARDPCCGIAIGLVCTYDADGCRTSADCATGYCAIDGARARCVSDGGPFCPL